MNHNNCFSSLPSAFCSCIYCQDVQGRHFNKPELAKPLLILSIYQILTQFKLIFWDSLSVSGKNPQLTVTWKWNQTVKSFPKYQRMFHLPQLIDAFESRIDFWMFGINRFSSQAVEKAVLVNDPHSLPSTSCWEPGSGVSVCHWT